ncbi:hypothetical protein FRB96_006929 [Tulasnella sp. 330]|nr:hypothetical protein FRB96_006929 [Tulasnella sp. 330]
MPVSKDASSPSSTTITFRSPSDINQSKSQVTLPASMNRPVTLSNLGNALASRYKKSRNMADLEDSIRYLQESLSLCPIGDSSRSIALSNLRNALKARHGKSGKMVDLE